ncbi:FAD-dependent oxidoreductase [Herminiimonas fonticola]|uniref:Pyridine nucleotide-disulfide oxidoreductase family protein n=1 Tax=Herminiimonas fonticola TaxID=303380 RepID=A0A4R6FZN0_9BURK|nr:FAD-dependent oxidoreductase [Herminiimonas fonticola]RBA23593.1 pyridine nucleotide-disulfide oxidoreductase family protein [Herminiimonas fonticola]TDN87473.1 pyridine nucleotide-disulfide oxidoreductase family protein [Herminiimonas fonticola]
MKRLVLVGGGHAHLSVLQALAQEKLTDVEVVLVTPSAHQNYSGMLPGWMAGHYSLAQCRIDLQALARAAGVTMVIDRIAGMDADRRCVGLPDGRHIEYDLLSLDVGSEIDVSWLEMAGDKLLPVKPLDAFFDAWPKVLAAANAQSGYRLVVVGGGAAGVELALAAHHALQLNASNAQVDLVASDSGLLPGHAPGVQRRMTLALARAGVQLHAQKAVGIEQGVMLSDATVLQADCVIAATGARAPSWLQPSRLLLDEHGYIAVNGQHQSLSHANVFAAGDICARQDLTMARSGVHAVHAGPVLAANLLATLKRLPLATYKPRKRSLYLLACGDQYAIASWGGFSAEGAWVWRWKDRIDRGFIARHSNSGRRRDTLVSKEAT